MRTLTTTIFVLALTASAPRAALAAAPAAGLRFERSVYADSADVALRSPEGVACDDRGALVIADTGNARLLMYNFKDGALDGGTQIKLAQLPYPVRVQIDSKGFVYALDRRSRRIVKLDSKGAFGGYVEGQGASVQMTPAAFKIGPGDNMYVLDVVARKVFVLDAGGRVTREIPLPKASGITDVVADSSGRIFIVDAVSSTIYSTEASGSAFEPVSKGLKEMVNFPTYITTDNRGKLYLVDQNGDAVVRVGIDGTFQGRDLAMGWGDGLVYYPQQLCLNSAGDVFLADRNNNRVQIFMMQR